MVTSTLGREHSSASPRRPRRRQQRSRACTRSRQGRPAIEFESAPTLTRDAQTACPTKTAGTPLWSRLLRGGSAVTCPYLCLDGSDGCASAHAVGAVLVLGGGSVRLHLVYAAGARLDR